MWPLLLADQGHGAHAHRHGLQAHTPPLRGLGNIWPLAQSPAAAQGGCTVKPDAIRAQGTWTPNIPGEG